MNDPQNNAPRIPSASEALIGRERIRGATRMIPQGMDAAAVPDEVISQVASDVGLFIRAEKINQRELAKAIGYSVSVISTFLAGTYPGSRGQIAIDLDQWLSEEEERRARPATTQFVWTNVALEIKAAASYCLDYKKIGMVYGPDTAGIGKTTALQAIAQELGPRRSTLVTIDKVDANPAGLFRKICVAMRLKADGNNRLLSDRIKAALTGRSHLLLIDQIHNLCDAKKDRPFYHLADLYDSTNSAQLWCGTADLVQYLDRRQQRSIDESLSQIRRRIFPRVDLMEILRSGGTDGKGEPLVTIDQIREMFAKNKLKLSGTAARFLCEIANWPESGGVGLCSQVVEYATMMAEGRRIASIDLPLLREAMRRAFTPKGSELLVQRIEEAHAAATQRVAKAG